MRLSALIVQGVTVAFWTWFAIGSSISEKGGFTDWIMHLLFPVVLGIAMYISYRSCLPGGLLSIGFGCFGLIWAIRGGGIGPVILGAPMLAAGILLMIGKYTKY